VFFHLSSRDCHFVQLNDSEFLKYCRMMTLIRIVFFIFDTCFLRDGFRKNIELHNRNLLCPILFWSTTVHIPNSDNKQTTFTVNQILTQKCFLLQNIKDLSYFRNGVFNNEECRISANIFKFQLKQVYATRNTFMHSRHLSTYGQNVKVFFDLNNC
jgi:hypothetical protein